MKIDDQQEESLAVLLKFEQVKKKRKGSFAYKIIVQIMSVSQSVRPWRRRIETNIVNAVLLPFSSCNPVIGWKA